MTTSCVPISSPYAVPCVLIQSVIGCDSSSHHRNYDRFLSMTAIMLITHLLEATLQFIPWTLSSVYITCSMIDARLGGTGSGNRSNKGLEIRVIQEIATRNFLPGIYLTWIQCHETPATINVSYGQKFRVSYIPTYSCTINNVGYYQ